MKKIHENSGFRKHPFPKGFRKRSDATTRLNSLPGMTRTGSMGIISAPNAIAVISPLCHWCTPMSETQGKGVKSFVTCEMA